MNYRYLIIAGLFYFSFLSCNPSEEQLILTTETENSIIHTAIFEVIQSDLEVLVFDVISDVDDADPTGQVESHIDHNLFFGRGSCRSETRDYDRNLAIIDFGNGCIDDKGITRSGKIFISYQFADDREGNKIEVSTENYTFQGIEYVGEITSTTLSRQNRYDPYEIELHDIEFIINSEYSYLVNGSRLASHSVLSGLPDQLMAIQTNHTLVNSSGNKVEISSISDIYYSSDCFAQNRIMPYRGNTRITFSQSDYITSFEDIASPRGARSSCDNIFTIKLNEDLKKEIDLSPFLSQ